MFKLIQIFKFLDPNKKINFLFLIFLSFIEIILDFASLASVYPFLINISGAEMKFFIFEDFFKSLGIQEFCILILILFLIKNIYIISLNFYRETFYQNIFYSLTTKLFNKYLKQDWKFFVKSNSSTMIHTIRNETALLSNLLSSYLSFCIETIMFLMMIGLLAYVNFQITVFIFCFFLIFGAAYKLFVQKFIISLSQDRQFFETKMLKNLYQSFSNVKIIKIFNVAEFASKQHKNKSFFYSRMMRNWKTIQSIPRYIIEIFTLIIFTFTIIFYFQESDNLIKNIPTLGFFVISFFRLIPLFNKITTALQNIIFTKPAIEEISKVLKFKGEIDKKLKIDRLSFNENIKCENLSFDFENKTTKEKKIINNLNFEIKKGEVFGIIGESGVGKSTLSDLIMGIIEPNSGKITVDGLNIKSKLFEWQKNIGYVSQSIYLNDDSIMENVVFGRKNENIKDEYIIKLLKITNLWDHVKNLPNTIHNIVGEKAVKLSGGQIQRIGIARALFDSPNLLILDEATSGLDMKIERGVIENIKKEFEDLTIIIISHRESTLKFCNRIIKLNRNE